MARPSASGARLITIVAAWALAACLLAVSGALHAVPALLPIAAFGTVIAGVIAYRRHRSLREAADHVSLRALIALHVIRVPIGVAILLETSRGTVPALFGNRAGPGDILVGALALFVALGPVRAKPIIVWCVLGLLDLVVAFSTAQYSNLVVGDPRMRVIADLPWALLPTLVVPVLILTHLLVLARIRRER